MYRSSNDKMCDVFKVNPKNESLILNGKIGNSAVVAAYRNGSSEWLFRMAEFPILLLTISNKTNYKGGFSNDRLTSGWLFGSYLVKSTK